MESSSPSSPPRPSLQSPELQSEFLQESQKRLWRRGGVTESNEGSVATSPSPPPSSSSCSSRPARQSLSSPELLSELRESRTRPLRHVPAHHGMTTIFSGRGVGGAGGGQSSGPASSTPPPANQKPH